MLMNTNEFKKKTNSSVHIFFGLDRNIATTTKYLFKIVVIAMSPRTTPNREFRVDHSKPKPPGTFICRVFTFVEWLCQADIFHTLVTSF